MKMAELLGVLFLARDVTDSVHLNTRSYAKHIALQEFYEGIIPLADALAEAYQGRHGLVGPIAIQGAKKATNVVEFLKTQLTEIEAARYAALDKTDTAIQNIVDEIVALYLSTLYKLNFLT